MKKLLLMILTVLLLVGCNKKVEEKMPEDEVILENIKYKLNQDDSTYGIKYKIASNFRKTDTGNAINYFSEKIDGASYFVFRIFYYKNKSIDYAIKDSTITYDRKWETKVGDLDYTVVHFINPTNDGSQTNIYYYKHNNDVYAFCFTAIIDLSKLEDVFLKQIAYE